MKIIPTIFAHNKKEFQQRFEKLLPIAREFQIDFMDGRFVSAKSVRLRDIPILPSNKNFEAHLMVENPEKYLVRLKKKGFKKIIFHVEATNEPEKIIRRIRALGMKPMVAIKPENSLVNLPKTSEVLFMGVHPGKEHQKFIPGVYKKISLLRKTNKDIFIQVDGGINSEVIKKLAKLKVNAVNSGSYIADSPDPRQTLKKLNSVIR